MLTNTILILSLSVCSWKERYQQREWPHQVVDKYIYLEAGSPCQWKSQYSIIAGWMFDERADYKHSQSASFPVPSSKHILSLIPKNVLFCQPPNWTESVSTLSSVNITIRTPSVPRWIQITTQIWATSESTQIVSKYVVCAEPVRQVSTKSNLLLHNNVRAVTDLPYFSFKIATTLNLTLECKTVSYWLKF